jgi:hypothetical protein
VAPAGVGCATLAFGLLWRTHSCVPRPHSWGRIHASGNLIHPSVYAPRAGYDAGVKLFLRGPLTHARKMSGNLALGELLDLAAHKLGRGIDSAFLLYALKFRQRVSRRFLPRANLGWGTRLALALLYAAVDFTIFRHTIRESLRWGHLTIRFAHID